MPTLTATQHETLVHFTSGADRLEKAITGLTEQELDNSCAPGEWTIRQMVHHVADDGDAWSMPFKKALVTPGARVRFEGFPGNDVWAAALAFDTRPIQASVALVKAHRQHLKELAEHFSNAWEQSVMIVDDQGRDVQAVSVEQILIMIDGHLTEHVTAIETIKQQHAIQGIQGHVG
jgi:hypothetical protein